MADPTSETFVYQAQSSDGQVFSGTIDAPAVDDAARKLQSLQLSVTRLQRESKKPSTPPPFKPADFLAFNQQLAALTASGLPVERSLRLMARELNDKRHTAAMERIATQLEKGNSLADAFASERSSFPPLYASLIEAGVQSNNLPAMLLNLGRHGQTMQRLRAAWWRSASYPLAVLVSLLVVMAFIWTYVLPQFLPMAYGPIFRRTSYGYMSPTGGKGIDPNVAWTLTAANISGYSIMGVIVLVLLSITGLWLLQKTKDGPRLVHEVVLRLPLVGPIVKSNLIARWCDALQLGVQAGIPLPAALALARDAVPSERLQEDTALLIAHVSSGRSMELDSDTRFLPALVPASLQMGIEKNDLPVTTGMLTQMYGEQTEIRLSVLPRVLSPILLIFTATCLGLAVAAMLIPMVSMIRALTGP